MTKPAAIQDTEAAMASAIEVAPGETGVAQRVMLVPYGQLSGGDGRGPWLLDGKEHAEAVIAATRTWLGSRDMLVNYDHQSEYAAQPGIGGRAKAAGWIKPSTLEAGDDGIYAQVDWTEPAAAALQAREYRYQSPHFRYFKSTGRISRLANVALTNSPNLDVPALASQQEGSASTEGELMSQIALAPLVAVLALSATAGEADVLAAIGGLKARADNGDAALNSTRAKLGLGDDADTAAVLNAIGGLASASPDPKLFVPKAGYDELKARIDRLDEDRVLNAVDQAVEGGKLAPAMRDWAISLGKSDEAALQSYLGVVPAFAGGATIKGDPVPEKGKLTAQESALCSQLGVSEADFLKTRDEEAA